MGPLKSLMMVMLNDKPSKRFALGVLFGLSFSISTILATIGIMDGFISTLKKGLKTTTGDIVVYSNSGFFDFESDVKEVFERESIEIYSPQIQTEGFLIEEGASQGILIQGVEEESYKSVTNVHPKLKPNQVAVGKELASKFKLSVGSEVVIALANGNREFSDLPKLERLVISDVVEHGVFEKDSRLIYMPLADLQSLLGGTSEINSIALNIPSNFMNIGNEISSYTERVKQFARKINMDLPFGYSVRPFWRDYSTLLEAVEIEKYIIGMILQLVVIISVFNVLAFVVFLNEKKSKEIFLFRALGMENREIFLSWISLVTCIWIGSCFLSVAMVEIFEVALQNFSVFNLPGKIYHMGRLNIILDFWDYCLVFSLAFVWLLIISLIGLRKIRNRSILYGLRKEFA